MPSLEKIIDYALSQSDNRSPSIIDGIIKSIRINTHERVFVALSGYDQVRISEEAAEFAGRWDIDRALVSVYSLLESLRKNYDEVYKFQMSGFSYEDSEYIVNLKHTINDLLIDKASGLFESGNRKGANRIKNDQMDNIQQLRYPSYEDDRDKWLSLERKWNRKLDKEDGDTVYLDDVEIDLVYAGPVPERGRNHFVNGKIGTSSELRAQEQWIMENDRLLQECDHLVGGWKLEDAMNLCLDRLWFFLGIDNPDICTVLTITNAPYLSAWERAIADILKHNFVWNEYIVQKIYLIIDNRHLPYTIRTLLSNTLLKWWAF